MKPMLRQLTALCFAVVLVMAQDRHPVTGRTYAHVMSSAGADWLTRPEREAEEEPDRALDLVGIPKDGVVADVGAGNGYITRRLAARVGPGGKVYAVDIQQEMLDMLGRNMRQRKLDNVEPVLGAVDDPRLPAGALDLIILVDVYHEFSEPQKMVRKMRDALKPDGRLVLLEYRGEDPNVPIRPEHKMTVQQVKAELEPENLRLDKLIDALPRQHILIFKKSK